MYSFLFLIHLISASVWLGGMILMGTFVPVVRKHDESGVTLKALANKFGQIGWVAYFLGLFSGMSMYFISWSSSSMNEYFNYKMILFASTGLLTYLHSKLPNLAPKFKGMIQGMILITTLGVFYFAILFST